MAGLLLRLPIELRLQIYGYIMQTEDRKILIGNAYNLSAQLLRTSRAIYSECLSFLYGEHTFSELTKHSQSQCQHQHHEMSTPCNWRPPANMLYLLGQIGPVAASCIRSVELQENWDHVPWHGPDFCSGFETLTDVEKISIHVFYKLYQQADEEYFGARRMSEKLVRETVFGKHCKDRGHGNCKPFATLVARIHQLCEWEVVFEVNDLGSWNRSPSDERTQFRSRVRFLSLGGAPLLDGGGQTSAVIESRTRKRTFRFGMVPHTGVEYSEWTERETIDLTRRERMKIEDNMNSEDDEDAEW